MRRLAILFGDEWPQVKVKKLATSEEKLIAHEDYLRTCKAIQLVILSAACAVE